MLIHWPELYPILIRWDELYPILIHWPELYPIFIHCRTIPYLNTLNRTIPYLNTLIPYPHTMTRTIPYLNTLKPYLKILSRIKPYLNTIPLAANPIRLSRQPSRQLIRIEYYVTESSRRRWRSLLGSQLESYRYTLSQTIGTSIPPSDLLTLLLLTDVL